MGFDDDIFKTFDGGYFNSFNNSVTMSFNNIILQFDSVSKILMMVLFNLETGVI